MALLICILTFWVLLGQCSREQIVCQSEDDYYRLLYRICIQSSPCKHLFHLYPLDTASDEKIPETTDFIDYRNQRDFDLFTHQLSRSLIFRIYNTDVIIKDERRLVLWNLVPEVWLSEIDVHIVKSAIAACSEGEIIPNHAIHALYAMHLYKITVSDEFFCRDPNERFLLDPETDLDYCLCKKSKSCHNESNFDHYLTIFMPILVFALLIFAFAIIANLFYTRHLLQGC